MFIEKAVTSEVYCDYCEEDVEIIIETQNVELKMIYEECQYCGGMIQARCVY